jgi:hypothetical protein
MTCERVLQTVKLVNTMETVPESNVGFSFCTLLIIIIGLFIDLWNRWIADIGLGNLHVFVKSLDQ